jgi:transcriptional regulator with XRE-family HTH domain
VAVSERRRDRGLSVAADIRRLGGMQVRVARRSSGLSLRAAAQSVGLSPSTFSRIERAEVPGLTVEELSLALVAVGLAPSLRAYPSGDPARDTAQLRLLERFRSRLPSSAPWHTEVPIPIPGDLRAIDARTILDEHVIGVEAETLLSDVQGTVRRCVLKKRDAGLDRLVLLLADTRHNRAVLADHRALLRDTFPLDTRVVLGAMSNGRAPGADGIVIL